MTQDASSPNAAPEIAAGVGARLASAATLGNVAHLFSPRSGLLPKLVLAAGVSYLFLPVDLIPDRLGPVVGHLDEAGFLLLGTAGGLLLAVPTRNRADPAQRPWMQRLSGWAARAAAARLPGRLLLRSMLGRWPDAPEQAAFVHGLFATSHALPPLLRAAAYVPAARPMLSRSMLLAAATTGPDTAAATLSDAQRMGNPLTIWQGPKVRFLHLEKTAGSSLIEVLAAQFHPLQIHSDTERRHADRSRLERERLASRHRAASVVWGHYDLPSLRRLDGGEPRFLFCLLREPRARILSLYYFWRSNRDEPSVGVRAAQANGLLGFLRSDDPGIVNDIDNMYARRFTGLYATNEDDPLASAPDAALAAARAAQDGLDFVGLSGRLGESLAILGRMLGFTPPPRTPEVNVQARSERNVMLSTGPTQREPITPEIDAELRRLTRFDDILYAEAERRFHALATTPSDIHVPAPAVSGAQA